MAGASKHPSLYMIKPKSLLDVFPVSGVQAPRKNGKHAKEQQHDYTQLEAVFAHGLGHKHQKTGEIGHGLVVFNLGHGTGLGQFKANKL